MILHYKHIDVYYEDEGQGDAIVLLHGFLENSSMWSNIKPHLLSNHRIISIDLLGHGKTPCLGYIHTMKDMADMVLVVIEHLQLKTYKLIGHSMGGYVALSVAEKNPNAVLGLCLMNSTYEADDKERKALRKRANKMVQNNFEQMVRMSFTNLFSSESRENHKDKIAIALKEALKTPLQGYIAAQEGMRVRDNKFNFLKDLKAKKLIIIAKDDPVISGEAIISDTNGTDIQCEEIAHGHMSHIENLSELTYLFLRFI